FGPRGRLKYEGYKEDWKAGVIEGTFYQIRFPIFDSNQELIEELEKGNFIHGSSMFRREAFDDVGGYKKTNVPEDYNLFTRIISKGWKAKKTIKTNLEYRQHSVGQANDVLSLQTRMLFYKNKALYEKIKYSNLLYKKNKFEKSKWYEIPFYTFK